MNYKIQANIDIGDIKFGQNMNWKGINLSILVLK